MTRSGKVRYNTSSIFFHRYTTSKLTGRKKLIATVHIIQYYVIILLIMNIRFYIPNYTSRTK